MLGLDMDFDSLPHAASDVTYNVHSIGWISKLFPDKKRDTRTTEVIGEHIYTKNPNNVKGKTRTRQ